MNEPIDHEIDITIEAVTGTVYDLCVSPFETILGIKTKIQRLEGTLTWQTATQSLLQSSVFVSTFIKIQSEFIAILLDDCFAVN